MPFTFGESFLAGLSEGARLKQQDAALRAQVAAQQEIAQLRRDQLQVSSEQFGKTFELDREEAQRKAQTFQAEMDALTRSQAAAAAEAGELGMTVPPGTTLEELNRQLEMQRGQLLGQARQGVLKGLGVQMDPASAAALTPSDLSALSSAYGERQAALRTNAQLGLQREIAMMGKTEAERLFKNSAGLPPDLWVALLRTHLGETNNAIDAAKQQIGDSGGVREGLLERQQRLRDALSTALVEQTKTSALMSTSAPATAPDTPQEALRQVQTRRGTERMDPSAPAAPAPGTEQNPFDVRSVEDAEKLPSGAYFRTQSGRIMRKN